MRKTWVKVLLVIAILILIILGIRLLKSTDQGTPNQEQKGNPLDN